MEGKKSLLVNPWVNRFVLGFVVVFGGRLAELGSNSAFLGYIVCCATLFVCFRLLPFKPEERLINPMLQFLKAWFNRYFLTMILGALFGGYLASKLYVFFAFSS